MTNQKEKINVRREKTLLLQIYDFKRIIITLFLSFKIV